MLLRRYGSLNYIFQMPPDAGLDFIKKVREIEAEECIWQMWLACYPYMTEENYMSFEDYKDEVTGKNICRLSSNEILQMAEEIEKKRNESRGDQVGC